MTEKDNNAIVRFSLIFIKYWRISILLLISIIGIGFFSYTQVLKRESMPPVEVPACFIVSPYFVNDVATVSNEVTKPIEKVISQLPEVKKVVSSSSANISFISVTFNEGIKAKDGMKIVKESLVGTSLPKMVSPSFNVYDAGKIDGTNDMIFTISGEGKTMEELQSKAAQIAKEIESLPEVSKAEALNNYKEELNPLTGKTFVNQVSDTRLGYTENGTLKFVPAVNIGIVKKNADVGSIQLSEAVRSKVSSLEKDNKLSGFKATFSLGDQSVSLNKQIDDLQVNAFESLIIVLIVIFFIINWRASLVTIIFIPTVFAATFIGFALIGYSINMMTLFALVLVLGLFIDDAIVIVEAIDAQKQAGNKGLDAVKRAIQKVGLADITGTLTTMLLFVPLVMITGIMGDFIRIMPVTVILALGLSLIIALTIITFFSSIFLAEKSERKPTGLGAKINDLLFIPGRFVTQLGEYVGRGVNFYLSNKLYTFLVIVFSVVLVGLGLFVGSKIPFALFPAPKDSDFVSVVMSFNEGTTYAKVDETFKSIETLIKEKYENEVKVINYLEASNSQAYLYIELTPMKDRVVTSEEMTTALNEKFKDFKGMQIKAAVPSAGPVSGDYAFQMQVFSEDTSKLKTATDSIKHFMTDLKISDTVKVEDVVVNELENISEIDGKRYAQIQAKITPSENQSGDLQILTEKIKDEYTTDKLKQLGLEDKALGFDLGSETEMMGSFNSALIGIFAALIVMYAILVLQFNSFTQPFLVFLGIPFSFVLLFPGLAITNNQFSFFVVIGLSALIGILANNIIMLLDFAKIRVLEEQKDPQDAIVGAIKRRFRPLIATTTITISGLLPLAIQDPFWSSLALTIIFGLIACTTMVIFVLPAYYVVLEYSRVWVRKMLRIRAS